jgi:hypothetical protein
MEPCLPKILNIEENNNRRWDFKKRINLKKGLIRFSEKKKTEAGTTSHLLARNDPPCLEMTTYGRK